MKTTSEKILENLTDFFIFFVIIIFPIVVNSTGFFKILECKYLTYLGAFSIYCFAIIIVVLYAILIKKERIFANIKISSVHKILLAFLFVNILSTILSPYFKNYNIFIGVGRGEGLITISMYALTFVFVTLFGKIKKEIFYYFQISGILFCSIAILQFLGFNPFNMFQDGIGTHNVSFMGTIGNVDFISAYFCLIFPISVVHYIFSNDDKKNVIDLIVVFMIYVIFQVINVNSGRVALLLTFIIFLPFVLLNNKKFAKSLKILTMIMLAYFFNLFINPEYHYDIGRIKICLNISIVPLCFAFLAVIFYILSRYLEKIEYNKLNKKNILKIYIAFLALAILLLAVIYIGEFSSRFGPIYELNRMLHGQFNDEYGTYRIFLWKRAISLIKDYPIIGTGPDTFAIRFMDKFSEDVSKIGELTVNDTAANVYLTMLVNIGVSGLLLYLIFIVSLIIRVWKNKNYESIIILSSVVCYLIQDIFNLWVIIVTPIFWLTLALLYKSCEDNRRFL